MADIVVSGNSSGSVTLRAPDVSGTTILTLPTTSGTLVTTAGGSTVPFALGSAAAPSITFTGDTNTGMFSPGADTIAFTEGGVESMRIDASGNVQVGTTSGSSRLTIAVPSAASTIRNALQLTDETQASVVFQLHTDLVRIATGGSDALAFDTNSAERMRIDSSGNVGIGSTSADPFSTVNTRMVGISSSGGGTTTALNITSGAGSRIQLGIGTTRTALIYSDSTNYTAISTETALPLLFQTNQTERMRIDSSGRVLIGTTSGSYGLVVGTGATDLRAQINGSNQYQLQLVNGSNSGFWIGSPSADAMAFSRGDGVERMRIDSSGNLLVGTTSPAPGYGNTNTGVQISGSGSTFSRAANDYVMVVNQNTPDGSNYYQVVFRVANVTKGSIISTSSTTSYNTSSDYRLKENIAPMTDALDVVQQLKPVTYSWKADGSSGQGFIAHELAEVIPDCVTGEKDAVDEEGNIKPQGIDTSFLVATLTAAIQEQQQIITDLKARIETLENK